MSVSRFGDWEKAKQVLGTNLGARLAQALRQATVKNAMLLVREIKKGITSRLPAGSPLCGWLRAPSRGKAPPRR